MRWLKIVGALLAVAAVQIAAGGAESPRKVKLVLNWHAQAQFAGFYMAKAAGFYSAAGLDVELLHVSPEQNTGDYLESGRADFATDWLINAMLFACKGIDVVQVTQFERRCGLLLVARRWIERGGKKIEVNSITDLAGARIGMWMAGSYWKTLNLLIKSGGLTDYQPVEVLKNVDLFLYGGVDAISAMTYNEYFQILSAGLNPDELRVFPLGESGNVCGEGIYTTSKMARENPAVCRKLALASMRGWELARKDPDGALAEVKRQCRLGKVPFSEAHQRWMLEHCLEVIFPDGAGNAIDSVSKSSYEFTRDLIVQMGVDITGTAMSYAAFCPFAPGDEK
ncbi:MAG: ABC transporter substrate-binding protein [Victivallaceae bacterium]|nr:ABC transporter substrate-binding protein [Victivallaceae bacterium]